MSTEWECCPASKCVERAPRRLSEAFFFYSKCKYILYIFFWDSFFMLHAHSLSVQDLRREAPAKNVLFLVLFSVWFLFFFYCMCKYTLGIFLWDSFSMLHGHSLSLQDLRRDAPASLEARFTADRSTFSQKTLFFRRKSYLFW